MNTTCKITKQISLKAQWIIQNVPCFFIVALSALAISVSGVTALDFDVEDVLINNYDIYTNDPTLTLLKVYSTSLQTNIFNPLVVRSNSAFKITRSAHRPYICSKPCWKHELQHHWV